MHCALLCSRKDNPERTKDNSSFYSIDFFFIECPYFPIYPKKQCDSSLQGNSCVYVYGCVSWEMLIKQLSVE